VAGTDLASHERYGIEPEGELGYGSGLNRPTRGETKTDTPLEWEDAVATTHIPINVYRENERIMVSTPIPGLEPSNIHIQIDGRTLSIRSGQRGPGQDRMGQYVQEEWTAGPYDGVVTLPGWVNVEKANATYDNGVLVIIFPESHISSSGVITMEKIGTSKGSVVGHVGKDLRSPEP
jgi:HSP20 family protein